MKLWTEQPGRAENADLLVCAGLLRVVAVMQDERALGEEEEEESGPTSPVTRAGFPTASIASGRTSNSATPTTIPPVNAIRVVSSRCEPERDEPARECGDDGQHLRAGPRSRSRAVTARAVDLELVRLGAEAVLRVSACWLGVARARCPRPIRS